MQLPRTKVLIIPFAALALTACATPDQPPEELAVAQSDLDQALSSGATQYSPDMVSSAREKLRAAHEAVDDGDMDRARRLAEEAQLDAQLAMARTDAAETMAALESVEAGLEALRQELRR